MLCQFTALAGKEDHLLLLGFFPQDIHGGGQTGIIKAHQSIVQYQWRIRGQFFRNCQTQRQIQLIDGAVAAATGLLETNLRCRGSFQTQVRGQLQPVVATAGEPGKQPLGFASAAIRGANLRCSSVVAAVRVSIAMVRAS